MTEPDTERLDGPTASPRPQPRSAGVWLNELLTAALRALGVAIFRLGLHRLVVRLGRARPKVLCYHAIEPRETDFTRGLRSSTSPEAFAEHLRFLAQHYHVVPLADVERGTAPGGAVAITFDDGYRSVLRHAVPRLAERGWPSTHFVVTDAIGNRSLVWVNELTWFMWNHPAVARPAIAQSFGVAAGAPVERVIAAIRERYEPAAVGALLAAVREAACVEPEELAREAQLYLDWRDVATMRAAGLTFGNHTATHPSLPRLDEDAQRDEIERARAVLESHVGRVSSLAVPFGDVDDLTRRAAFESGHTSIAEIGGVNDGRDPSRIARVLVTARDAAELFAEMEVVTPVRALLRRVVRGARPVARAATATVRGARSLSTHQRPRTTPLAPHTGLRVLYVWFAEYPWDVRVEKMCAALTAAGHEVHLVARNRRGEPRQSTRPEAIVHRLAQWPRVDPRVDAALQFPAFLNPRWMRLLGRVAREVEPDVIIVRDLPLCPAAIRLGRRLGVPVVLDMAENYPAFMRVMREAGHHDIVGGLLRSPRVLTAVERFCLRRVDRVLTVVDESAARVARLGVPADRIRVISNTPARALAERTDGARSNHRRRLEVVYLGLLETPRGIDDVLDAAVLLRESATPIRVTLVGDGRDGPWFRARASAVGLTRDDVVFAGHRPLDEALRLVAEADVGVVPLRRCEAYDTTVPNKLFDYMALGLPVVTSDTLPSARIVRETGAGEVYRAGEAKSLAAALRRLADPDARRSAGEAARRAVLDRYNWERDAATLRETIEELAAARADVTTGGRA